MTFAQLLYHLANLLLPALALALCMPLAGRWVTGRPLRSWRRHVLAHAGVGVLVLIVGLLVQGHDGRISTYLALVLVAASLEWALQRAWRA